MPALNDILLNSEYLLIFYHFVYPTSNALTNSKANQVYLHAPVCASVMQLEGKLYFGSPCVAQTWGISIVEKTHFCSLICHWLERLRASHSVSLTFIIHLYPQSCNAPMVQLWNTVTDKWWLLPPYQHNCCYHYLKTAVTQPTDWLLLSVPHCHGLLAYSEGSQREVPENLPPTTLQQLSSVLTSPHCPQHQDFHG